MTYRLTRDWVAVRELPAPPDSQIVLQVDNPNKRPGTVITGLVEQTGPEVTDVTVGQTIWYEIEMGKARLPWDFDVRIMRQSDIAAVEA